MSRNVTVADIISRAQIHADMRNSDYINPTEALQLFNEIYPELYDELIDIDENYYTRTFSFPISNTATGYDLPADFYKIIGVDFQATAVYSPGTERITIYRYNEAERNSSFTSSINLPSGTIFIRYVPACPIITDINTVIDGVSGWDRLCSLRLAMDMMDSEESNTDRVQRKYAQRLQSMQGSLERDIGMPATVSDVTRPSVQYLYSSIKYRLYDQQIDFISTELLGATTFGGPF